MTLSDLLNYFTGLGSKDIFQLSDDLNKVFQLVADSTKIPVIVWGIVGVLIAVAIGVLGYKLIKPVLAAVMACIGFFAGVDVYLTFIWQKVEWMPVWSCYVIAVILAALFFLLTWKRPMGGMFSFAAVVGFTLVSFYTDSMVIIMAGGILLAMLSAIITRFVFILVTGALSGLFAVCSLSQILPNVEFFQIKNDNMIALIVVGAVALLFVVVQLIINRHHKRRI